MLEPARRIFPAALRNGERGKPLSLRAAVSHCDTLVCYLWGWAVPVSLSGARPRLSPAPGGLYPLPRPFLLLPGLCVPLSISAVSGLPFLPSAHCLLQSQRPCCPQTEPPAGCCPPHSCCLPYLFLFLGFQVGELHRRIERHFFIVHLLFQIRHQGFYAH